MPDALSHLTWAARSFRRNPGFCAATLLSLALGIGANVAVFSVVDALLLRPLPFPDAGRLVLVDGAGRGPDRYRLDVAEWVKDMRAFSSVGLFTSSSAFSGSRPLTSRRRLRLEWLAPSRSAASRGRFS